MTYLESILLGLVQGVTEFLPVSSSGHLVLAQDLMGIRSTGDASFEVVVHVGTLLSILLVLHRPIRTVACATGGLFAPSRWGSLYRNDEAFRLLIFVALGTLPVLLVGLTAKSQIESLFDSSDTVAGLLMVTACLLATTFYARDRQQAPTLAWWMALLIGCAQAFAILPGISRSGTTIAVALLLGLSRSRAGEFSFLLAVPAIAGAAILNASAAIESPIGAAPLLLGLLAACASGTIALRLLLSMVKAGRLWWFAPYLVLVGAGWLIL